MQPQRVLTRPFVLTVITEFALCLSIGMLLAVIPVYADDELGVGSFGVALDSFERSARSPRVPADRRTDRRSPRTRILVVTGGPRCRRSVSCLTPLSTRWEALIALRVLTGRRGGLLLVGAATIVADLAPEHRRGEALSLYSLGLWGGLALGPVLGELGVGEDRFDSGLAARRRTVVSRPHSSGLSLPETGRTGSPAANRCSPTRLVHPAAVGPGLVLALMVFGFAGLGTFECSLRA